jgi:radical SAM superfamily enzyme YgiQ (UPF0313 family)
MRYEGPIYRPPSEADSLLIQATVGCPHNKCTFCMVYKKGPKFRIRKTEEIKEDLREAREVLGNRVKSIFFPSGNTIIMKTPDLAEVCRYSKELFPHAGRITVYGSAQYIYRKGVDDLKILAEAGLSRIHVGLESGDDVILEKVKKGSTSEQQIKAGCWVKEAGIDLSEYVVLGIGGKERTEEHITETVKVLNQIDPDFIRLRTFMPKVNTPMLEDIQQGRFLQLIPHEVIRETQGLIEGLDVTSTVTSDHYTNYMYVDGKLPQDRDKMLAKIKRYLKKDENEFRQFTIGYE